MKLADTNRHHLPAGPHIELIDATDVESAIHYGNVGGRDSYYRPEAYSRSALPQILSKSVTLQTIQGLHTRASEAKDLIAYTILTKELGLTLEGAAYLYRTFSTLS
jgi:hypothetical protein